MSRFGATILDVDGLRLSAAEKAFFREADPFGFILFARNIDTPDQVRALCADLREAVGREAFITIDQEGGRVQRLRGPHWRDWRPPLEDVHRAGAQAAEVMRLRSRIMAAELHDLGIDSNCAPLVDVPDADTHPFLTNRCYGMAPGPVAEIGRAVAEGLLAGGVVPIVKHIPGHGRARVDSHEALPRTDATLADLTERDFAPFTTLADLPMAMTAHVVYEALDRQAPATLSPKVITAIRDRIGFDGLLMTDDIGMKALRAPLDQISQQALSAGCDVILACNLSLADRRAVAAAAGRLDAAGQARADAAVAARRAPDGLDIPALEAQLHALLGGAVYV